MTTPPRTRSPRQGWRPPTRRAFVGLLAAAAAALHLPARRRDTAARPAKKPIWIGHH